MAEDGNSMLGPTRAVRFVGESRIPHPAKTAGFGTTSEAFFSKRRTMGS